MKRPTLRRKRTAGPAERTQVRIELDLPHELLRPSTVPVLRQIESFLREQEVEETGSVLRRAAELLDELGAAGYAHVDHWEVVPGGWLPLPEPTHAGILEPVGHLIRALKSPSWGAFAKADAFAVRLSAPDGRQADAVVRRVHREREHSITVDLWDPAAAEVRGVVGRLRERFSPLKVRLHR